MPTSPFTFYNFRGNVVTHSDGCLLHGIGGCTIMAPSFGDRIPVVVDRATTLTGPGRNRMACPLEDYKTK